MKNKFIPIALCAAMFAGFNSCETLEDLCNISEDDLGSGEVFVTSLNHMIDIYDRLDNAYKDSTLNAAGAATIDGAVCSLTTDSLIIDFGNGAVCADGKERRGSIRAGLNGDYLTPGGGASGMLSGYKVNDVDIVGDITMVNDGPLGANPVVNVSSTGIGVGTESDVDFDLDLRYVDGFPTPDFNDDVFNLFGDINGSDLITNSMFQANVIDSLHYDYSCVNYIENGVLDLTLTGDSVTVGVINIDFIDSDGCNNLVTFTAQCDSGPISFTYPID